MNLGTAQKALNKRTKLPFLKNTKSVAAIVLFFALFCVVGCDDMSSQIALGTLERDRITHTATANEIIVDLPLLRGGLVTKGDVLVQLDSRHQSALTAKAAAFVAAAQANLDKLHNGARSEEVAAASAELEGIKAALTESMSAYIRANNLVGKGLVSQATLDQALAVKDANTAAAHAAEEKLRLLTNGTRYEDLLIGEANLAVMKAELASENKKLADLTIIATRDGLLDNLPWNLGERVTIGSPLAIVTAGNAPYARIYVPETYRVNVRVGDSLIVHVDGLQQSITGKVRWISTEPAFTPYYALNQEERARLMYLAEVQLPDNYLTLPSGIPVEVELP
jgi:HlyD family secretion protein